MKTLGTGFEQYFWNTTPGNAMLKDYLEEVDS